MLGQGNYKIGFRYPCEVVDNNPVSHYTGGNSSIYRSAQHGVAKTIWPNRSGDLWWRYSDLMYDMNLYTVMDQSLDDMVD